MTIKVGDRLPEGTLYEFIEVEGNVYLDRFEGVSTGGGRSLKAESHIYLAIFRADVDLRLAWGMTERPTRCCLSGQWLNSWNVISATSACSSGEP